MSLNLSLMIIKWEFQRMQKYLNTMGSTNTNEINQVEEKYNEFFSEGISENISEHEIEIILGGYQDEFLDVGRTFPRFLLSSFIMAWYAFVEQQLLDFCEKLKLSINVTPTERDILGTGIDRARNFLQRTKNYTIADPHWKELKRIQRLRNRLIHHGNKLRLSYRKPEVKAIKYEHKTNGEISVLFLELDENFYQYLKEHNLLQNGGMWLEIHPTFDYCQFLIEFGIELFTLLHVDFKEVR